jgi:hypothetical protein
MQQQIRASGKKAEREGKQIKTMLHGSRSLALAFDVMSVAPVVVTLSCARYFQGSTKRTILTLSHSHTLTLSHSHTLTLYLLSRQTAPTPIVLSQYTLLPLRFPLLTRHLVALYDGYLYFLSCTFKESERLLSFGGPFLNDHQPKPLVG